MMDIEKYKGYIAIFPIDSDEVSVLLKNNVADFNKLESLFGKSYSDKGLFGKKIFSNIWWCAYGRRDWKLCLDKKLWKIL